jgi:hypothetical protein
MAAIITSITIILSIFFLLPYLYFLPKVSPPMPLVSSLKSGSLQRSGRVLTRTRLCLRRSSRLWSTPVSHDSRGGSEDHDECLLIAVCQSSQRHLTSSCSSGICGRGQTSSR